LVVESLVGIAHFKSAPLIRNAFVRLRIGNHAGQTSSIGADALTVCVPDHCAEHQEHADRQRQDQWSSRGLIVANVESAIVIFEW
jgi:hypothetical protein